MENEKERLSEYTTYEDGTVDKPFLTPETRENDDDQLFYMVYSLDVSNGTRRVFYSQIHNAQKDKDITKMDIRTSCNRTP